MFQGRKREDGEGVGSGKHADVSGLGDDRKPLILSHFRPRTVLRRMFGTSRSPPAPVPHSSRALEYQPCATEGCAKHPHFGFADGGPRYCAQHRAEGMVDVKHRRCAVKGCRRDRLQLTGGPRKRGKFCEVHCAESEFAPGEQSRIAQQAKKTAPACTYESEDQNKRKRDADM